MASALTKPSHSDFVAAGPVRLIALAVLVVVLHYTVLRTVLLFGVRPDVLLLAVAVFALRRAFRPALVLAFAAGMVADLFTLLPFGTSALAYMGVAVVVHLLARRARPVAVVDAIVVAIASFVGVIAQLVIAGVSGAATASALHGVWVALVVALVNAVLAVPALRLFGPREGSTWGGRQR